MRTLKSNSYRCQQHKCKVLRDEVELELFHVCWDRQLWHSETQQKGNGKQITKLQKQNSNK